MIARREFFGAMTAVFTHACSHPPVPPPQEREAAPTAVATESVSIVEFSSDGRNLGPATVPKLILADEEWRRRLSSLGYAVMRGKDTEIAFTGRYNKHYAAGIYRCAGCNTALFTSETKFDSGTGWPSFWAPIASENVYTAIDESYGIAREEVLCRRCDAHLGHVFPDGPPPTGLRYCMNSAAMVFSPAA